MRNRMPRMKRLPNWRNVRVSFCSSRRTWTTYTSALDLRRRKWCKFTETFLRRVARVVIGGRSSATLHTRDDRDKSGLAGARPSIIEFSEQEGGPENGVSRCTKCDALMRPGVVWFGEPLPLHETERVESYLQRDSCGVVIMAGTTAKFGLIICLG